MLGLRRRRTERAAAPANGATITADLTGATIQGGQVAVGENINQFYAEAGSVVTYVAPEKQARPRLRPLPVERLPRDFPKLVGREEQVEAARAALASGSAVEFFGEPGIGKSVLLRYLAHHPGERSPEGTVHHAAAGEPPEDSLQFLFESFYECETTFVPTPGQLAGYLGERRAFLVLDDLDLERDELERLMNAAPGCGFLSASTERRLWGEGEAIELPGLEEGDALALVQGEAGRPLTSEEREALRALWWSVRGHPLRLLQAGGEIRRGPGGGRLSRMVAGGPGELEGSIADALSEEDRRLLSPLAALPAGSLHADDLAATAGVRDAEVRLRALEERALVQSHSPRYTLAGGLGEKLLEEGERRGWRERLVKHFAHVGDELREVADGPAALSLLEWSASEAPSPETIRLARVADRTFNLAGRWGSWRRTAEAALTAARTLGDRAAEAWSLHQLGTRALCLGDLTAAKSSLVAALELREALGENQGAAITRHNLNMLSGVPPAGHGPRSWFNPIVLGVVLALVAGTVAALALTHSNSSSPGPTPAAQQGQVATAGTKPDLTVSIDSAKTVDTGGTPACLVTYDLANRGGSAAPPTVTGITLGIAGAVPVEQPAPALGAGETVQMTVPVPQSSCPPAQDIEADADATDAVPESDEANKATPVTTGSTTSSVSTSTTAPPTSTTSSTTSTTTTSTTSSGTIILH